MKYFPPGFIVLLFIISPAHAGHSENFDYFATNRRMISHGVQAVLTCNGLFTSQRTLEQVFAQELAYLAEPVGTAEGGEYLIDRERKAVAVGAPQSGPVMRAAFREGIGCIILERYAAGVDVSTKTRTWSTAKSIAVSLIGMLVDDGRLELDAPLGIEWLPEVASPESDPRNAISLRNVLHMSSGLYPVDSFAMEYATGSGLAYWAGASSLNGARNRGLIRRPGTFWDYENYDTLLAVYAMKKALGDEESYHNFPRKALLDRIGMRNTLLSTDRFGDFILSSQVYTNARDLARFGLLYLQNGIWDGERLLSEEWIEFVRTPAPATSGIGNFYGGQWWLVPDDRSDVPKDAYSTAGNRGQFVIVVPSRDTVIVRRGLDYGKQGFNRWDLTREVLRAIPKHQ